MDNLGATNLVKGCIGAFSITGTVLFLFFTLYIYLSWHGLIIWGVIVMITLIILAVLETNQKVKGGS